MRLPRRTPWANISELDEVCKLIYSEQSNLESKKLALQRLCAWKQITALPHALDVTIGLLTVVTDDPTFAGKASTSTSTLGLRQAYAFAIVRLVNSLVDPLQQGMYARPVAAIAIQIGLPAWFVELRHQATHEDLPSLAVLQDASQEALTWLLHNYFIPTLSPPSTTRRDSVKLTPVEPTIARYKSLVKVLSKDTTLLKKAGAELDRVYRDVERWIAEARIASYAAILDEAEDDEDFKVSWALDKLCDGLLARGGLVPVSKKKRSQPSSKVGLPPNEIIWSPLLIRLSSTYPTFPDRFISGLILALETSSDGVSYLWSIAGWIQWAIKTWEPAVQSCEPESIVKALFESLGDDVAEDNLKIMKIFVKGLAASRPILKSKVSVLLSTFETWCSDNTSQSIDASPTAILDEMTDRLQKLQEDVHMEVDVDESPSTSAILANRRPSTPTERQVAPGWTLLDETNWKPCPIGIDGRI